MHLVNKEDGSFRRIRQEWQQIRFAVKGCARGHGQVDPQLMVKHHRKCRFPQSRWTIEQDVGQWLAPLASRRQRHREPVGNRSLPDNLRQPARPQLLLLQIQRTIGFHDALRY
jgi:hypothetical protein